MTDVYISTHFMAHSASSNPFISDTDLVVQLPIKTTISMQLLAAHRLPLYCF